MSDLELLLLISMLFQLIILKSFHISRKGFYSLVCVCSVYPKASKS